jgi:FkbM family methyltransferase
MNLFEKIKLKLDIESRFFLEQKWGFRKPKDPHAISKSLLVKLLPENPVIIDCGAHVGADSVELARIFPKGVVHSFEPVPEIFGYLKNSARKYSNIVCYQLALSNQDGTAKMHVSSGSSNASSSLLKPTGHIENHPDVYFDNTIDAQTLTLDSWAVKNNVSRVDFLWLDMQGFELHMLKASNVILPKVKAIYTEVSVKETYENAVLYSEFKEWLTGQGFKVAIEAIPEGTDMGNVLFVKQA